MTTIVWFRQDLRISDNPALRAAVARGPIIPVFILESGAGDAHIGSASRWWLHHSLLALRKKLGGLVICAGDPPSLLIDLVEKTGATAVVWNRCYEPHAVTRDAAIKVALKAKGLIAESFNGGLLNEPWEIKTLQGEPYKVFSPYWRACLARPMAVPDAAPVVDLAKPKVTVGLGAPLEALGLLPKHPDWAKGWERLWQPGAAGALVRLEEFLADGLEGYATLRDRPDRARVSRLSPHLHWGEISPRQIVERVRALAAEQPALQADINKFMSEIGWREFANHLLFHFPELPARNWKPAFDAYPWQADPIYLKAWQRGLTGYPMVDAGMRELWQTGWMHNRVRMVVASFLIKHLRIDWRQGQAWFWDTLVDADLASNSASWQWVAGSGADAAPYYRIFNPMAQGEKFDSEGGYVRRWCPELARLPNEYLHAPFLAPASVLRAAGITLGRDYPAPIVDHAEARIAAMEGYNAVKLAGERARAS